MKKIFNKYFVLNLILSSFLSSQFLHSTEPVEKEKASPTQKSESLEILPKGEKRSHEVLEGKSSPKKTNELEELPKSPELASPHLKRAKPRLVFPESEQIASQLEKAASLPEGSEEKEEAPEPTLPQISHPSDMGIWLGNFTGPLGGLRLQNYQNCCLNPLLEWHKRIGADFKNWYQQRERLIGNTNLLKLNIAFIYQSEELKVLEKEVPLIFISGHVADAPLRHTQQLEEELKSVTGKDLACLSLDAYFQWNPLSVENFEEYQTLLMKVFGEVRKDSQVSPLLRETKLKSLTENRQKPSSTYLSYMRQHWAHSEAALLYYILGKPFTPTGNISLPSFKDIMEEVTREIQRERSTPCFLQSIILNLVSTHDICFDCRPLLLCASENEEIFASKIKYHLQETFTKETLAMAPVIWLASSFIDKQGSRKRPYQRATIELHDIINHPTELFMIANDEKTTLEPPKEE